MDEQVTARAGPDLTRNVRAIEHLKAELAAGLAGLYRAMLKGQDEATVEAMAALVMGVYLLARRMGVSPSRLDLKVEARARAAMQEGHELEQWYGDFSALYRHFQGGGRK